MLNDDAVHRVDVAQRKCTESQQVTAGKSYSVDVQSPCPAYMKSILHVESVGIPIGYAVKPGGVVCTVCVGQHELESSRTDLRVQSRNSCDQVRMQPEIRVENPHNPQWHCRAYIHHRLTSTCR
jgi:hypothetical protein